MRENLEDLWWFVIGVAEAAGLARELEYPSDGPATPETLRACLEVFCLALRLIDGQASERGP